MFLTARELAELTGRTRAAAQCRALERMRIVFLRDPDGRPRVLRSHVERLAGAEAGATMSAREPQLMP